MPGYYSLHKNLSNNFHFVLRADNNETILTSQVYSTKQGALTGIASCQANSPLDSQYDKRVSAANQPYFVLKAANHEIIGNSQMYASVSGRDNGIASCKTNGPTSRVVEV